MYKIKYVLLLFILLCASEITSAQYYFFGRNKVQYNEFEWYVLKTEHFDIYFYKGFDEIAEMGAYYAEDSYEKLKVKFNSVVIRRIPLIFYNTHIHFQQTNTTPGFIPEGVGGFFEFLKGRVVIPYMGSLEGFRHVINHELVHVFTMNKVARILSERRIPTDRYPPLWFIEGLAEYWSTTWDAQAEMTLRDAVNNNYFVGLKDMYRIYGSFLMYKEGQNFLQFTSENYGEEKILMMLENIWQFSDFNKLIEYVFNKSIEEIDTQWLYWLKQKYYPLVQKKAPPEITTDKLTNFGYNFSPSYYKQGDRRFIYFIANRDGYSSLYRLELKGDVKNEKDIQQPEMVLRGEKEEVFETFHLFEPSLSVSVKGLAAFVTKSGKTDVLHIFSIDKNEVIRTIQSDELISISSPKWSDSGGELVFQAIDTRGYPDIYVYDFNEQSIDRLTNDYYSDIDPVFVPGDSAVIFASDRTDGVYKKKYNLFRYRYSDASIDYITYSNANFSAPRFAGNSDELYCISDLDGTNNIWRLEGFNGQSGRLRQVSNFMTAVFEYTFTNRDRIVMSVFENSSVQLYDMDLKDASDSLVVYKDFIIEDTGTKWLENKIIQSSKKEPFRYENNYTLDYAQSQVSTDPVYGTSGGAALSLSDLFGNDNYFFLLYNTAEVQSELLKSFNVAISRINVGNRTNYAYGIFHFSGRRYDIRDSDEYYFERSIGGYFTMLYPLSKFDRLEASVSVANSDKQIITDIITRKALLVTNSISYVKDNSLWGPTGPLDGSRIRFSLSFTNDVKYSNVNYFAAIADYRHYLRLAYRSSLAIRAAGFYNEGKEARRYFMGGSWDLRGYPRWSIRGEKMWLTSVELRFPLLDLVYLRFPVVSLGFPNIRGALFFDAGSAWDEKYRETLGSMGAGFRINVFNVLTLRYDIGKKIQDDFRVFQKGWFYQFFFGWDF